MPSHKYWQDKCDRLYRERDDAINEVLPNRLQIVQLEAEVDILRKALVKYGDRQRMGFVEPSEMQQAIDRAFEAERKI